MFLGQNQAGRKKPESYRDCKYDEILDGSKMRCVKRNDIEYVGDGKLPNKYWVSVSNIGLICRPDDGILPSPVTCEWDEIEPQKGGTIAVFDTYNGAKEYMENLVEIGDLLDVRGEMFQVRYKSIEDRLTGELAYTVEQKQVVERVEKDVFSHEDLDYTQKEMVKRGAEFR